MPNQTIHDEHDVHVLVEDGRRWIATLCNKSMAEAFVAAWPLAYPSWIGADFEVTLSEHMAETWDAGVMAKSNSSSIFDRDVLKKNPHRVHST